jgi:hypothetical protein
VKLGETAFISFVADPDGAPVEISQRASLTGPLPQEIVRHRDGSGR